MAHDLNDIVRNIPRKVQAHNLGPRAMPHVREEEKLHFWDVPYLSVALTEGEFKEERDASETEDTDH